MSMQSKPYYWLRCDNCLLDADYGDYAAWAEADYALEMALESEWTTDDEKHHCPNCPPITKCQQCEKPAGEGAGDRDDHCVTCWEASA